MPRSCFVATPCQRHDKDEYKAAKDKIEANYKADKAACDAHEGQRQGRLREGSQGQGKRRQGRAGETSTSRAHRNARKVAEEKVKANYEVAKEKCDDQKGDAKSACVEASQGRRVQGQGRHQGHEEDVRTPNWSIGQCGRWLGEYKGNVFDDTFPFLLTSS